MKSIQFSFFLLFGLLFTNTPVMAHGGAGIELDTCVISIGNYRMHFTAYQPKTLGGKELCWDIPSAGDTILVFDLIEEALRDRPVEVRVVEEQSQGKGPSSYKTIAERPVQRYPRGTIELDTSFPSPGEYIAVVTLGGDRPLVFRTPMRVELQGEIVTQWIGVGILTVAIGAAMFWFERRSRKRKAEAQQA